MSDIEPRVPPPIPEEALPPGPPEKRALSRPGAIALGLAILLAALAVGLALRPSNELVVVRDSPTKGWTVWHDFHQGFTITFPPSWLAVDPVEPAAYLEAIRRANAELAGLIRGEFERPPGPLKLAAFDIASPTLSEGFASNLNVVVLALSPGTTRREFVGQAVARVRELPGATSEVVDEDVRIGFERGALVRSRVRLASPTGERVAAVTQYVVLGSNGRGYIISFTTTPEAERHYVSITESIIESFVALPAPSVSVSPTA